MNAHFQKILFQGLRVFSFLGVAIFAILAFRTLTTATHTMTAQHMKPLLDQSFQTSWLTIDAYIAGMRAPLESIADSLVLRHYTSPGDIQDAERELLEVYGRHRDVRYDMLVIYQPDMGIGAKKSFLRTGGEPSWDTILPQLQVAADRANRQLLIQGNGGTFVVVAVPIPQSEGILFGGIELTSSNGFLSQLRMNAQADCVFLLSKDHMLAVNGPESICDGHRMQATQLPMGDVEESHTHAMLRGPTSMSLQFPGLDLVILTSMGSVEALKESLNHELGLMLVVFVLVNVVLLWFGRQLLMGSVKAVADYGRRIRAREPVQSLNGYLREFDQLVEIYSGMGDDLQLACDSRQQAEMDRDRSEQCIRTILHSLDDGIIIIDEAGAVMYMNLEAEVLTGWPEHEAQNLPYSTIFKMSEGWPTQPIEVSEIPEIDAEGIVGGWTRALLVSREAREIQIETSEVPILMNTGEVCGAVRVFRDVTITCQQETKLRHNEKIQAIGHLASMIAHDFNNMLGGILSTAEVMKLENGRLNSQQHEYLESIIHITSRASVLTAKLLALGKNERTHKTQIKVHEVIDDAVSILKSSIDKKIHITVKTEAQVHCVMGDGSELENAFLNLGINASHAMPAGGELTFETYNIELDPDDCARSVFDIRPGAFLVLLVIDTGKGISADILPHVFDAFFTTKSEGEGSGLGLSTVLSVMKDHLGSISVTSREGVGTCFLIFLPCCERTVEGPQKEDDTMQALGSDSGHVLFVDDDQTIRVMGVQMLEAMGYRVTVAENGREAIDLYQQFHAEIDVVVMDMMMPEVNGRDAYLQMKNIDSTCRMILSSGYGAQEYLRELADDRDLRFLRKPYSIRQLRHVLISILMDQPQDAVTLESAK